MSAEPESAENVVPEGAADSNNNKKNNSNGKGERPKRDETPIEDLYDLSQPIPKVDKPDKEGHDKQLQELNDAIEAIKTERTKIQEKIDSFMNKDGDGKTGTQSSRNKLNELRTQKNALIEQKKVMRAQMDKMKDQTDKIVKDKKNTRSNVKFNSVQEIDAEIAKLMRKQETTSMSLNDEKRLIKEVEALQASKKFISQLKDKDGELDEVKEQRKNLNQKIIEKDKEIDALTEQINALQAEIKEANDKDTKKRDELQDLFKKRDELKKQVGDKIKEKDAIRDEFREKNNAWFNYQRAVRAQKKMQYEEEKRKREEEKAAVLAKIEEEEAKKIPYEEEQALCDFLADYLERTYLKKDEDMDKNDSNDKEEVTEIKDDPFAGKKPVGKKNEEEDTYFSKGKGKKKRVRQKKPESVSGPFTLSVDTFEQFGLVNLTPPISVDQVANSVKELREKKEWYKQQPRGSVPTAMQIRKEREKEAAKLRQSTNEEKGKQAGKSTFSLSNEEFTPLGAGAATASVNPSWGHKSSAPAQTVEDEDA